MTHVYVIQAEGGPVKVGVAVDPAKRLAALRTGTPYQLSLAHVEPIEADLRAIAVERAAHALLKAAHAHGEWFAVSADEARVAIHEAIARLRRGEDPRCSLPADVADPKRAEAVQCRAARAILQMSVRDLAAAAKVAPGTIVRLEAGEELKERTVEAIRAALEAAGIEFIAKNGGGPGVRDNRETE